MLGSRAGLRVWVTGRTEQARDGAVACGAAAVFASGERLPERVDAVMESVGEATWARSLRCVRPGGRIVVAGATAGAHPDADLQRFFFQRSVIGVHMGTVSEMRSLLALVERERLVPPVDSVTPLDRAADAFRQLEAGDLRGKVIVVP